MFGYVTINRQELKVKDLDTYQAHYCGLCSQLRKRYGLLGSAVLNYDMTFLSLLLSGLYEEKEHVQKNRCALHPTKRGQCQRVTRASAYAADMNFMLAYHDLMDDWIDERNITARLITAVYHRKYQKAAEKYPRQHRAIVNYVRQLHRCEKKKSADVEEAANLTGRALAELYVWKEDMWAPHLQQMGFALGKFIYLMDAYEDVEKDRKNGSYNPFLPLYEQNRLEEKAQEYLKLIMGDCCRAFEMLPILQHADLLRNILYSGIWMKFAAVSKKRRHSAEGKKKNGSI